MNVERPLRQEVNEAIRQVVEDAERSTPLKRWYTWHRRFLLGIDSSIEAAERRASDPEPASHPKLQRSAELALNWLSAQREKPGSLERTVLLEKAWAIYLELTN